MSEENDYQLFSAFLFSILFLFFCSLSYSILHPVSLSMRQEREVEKRRRKEKEEKREKKSREKLIVVFFTHCPTLFCFVLLSLFFFFLSQLSNASCFLSFLQFDSRWFGRYEAYSLVSPIAGSLFLQREPHGMILSLASKSTMTYLGTLSDSWRTTRGRLSIRDMRLRVAKLIL